MGKIRRFAAAAAVLFATCGGLLVPAPAALATTTASCPSGIQGRDYFSLSLSSSCAGFPDQGSPYVFQVGSLWVWRMVGLDFTLYQTGPATATCTAYQIRDTGSLLTTGCAFTR